MRLAYHRKVISIWTLLFSFGFFGIASQLEAASFLKRARYQKSRNNFNRSISLYKRHLRKVPKDYQAWNELAFVTYKVGLPKRALRYLKRVENTTRNKSYNYYYQGLCYAMEGKTEPAKDYFKKASVFNDINGANATFELAVFAYNQNKRVEAIQHLSRYTAMQPRGTFSKKAYWMLANARNGKVALTPVIGHEHPSRESALYRYSKLSLFKRPHFWYMQLGYQTIFETEFQPNEGNTLQETSFLRQAIVANAGIGLGPIKREKVSGWIGYSYQQRYFTDSTRFEEYFDDWTDFSYQPFRMDLLQRKHSLFADVRRSFNNQLFLGLYGRLEYEFRGSQFLGSPDDQELRQVFPLTQGAIFIPWVGYNWQNNSKSLAYLYFRKLVQKDAPNFSNQSYHFSDDSVATQDRLSFGLSHTHSIPKYDLDLNLEAFRYSFTFNNQWEDYVRWGFIAGGEHKILKSFVANLFLGYYSDTYKVDILRTQSCTRTVDKNSSSSASTSSTPKNCARNDQGFMMQTGLMWNYTPFHRLGLHISFVQNSNETLQEFEGQKIDFKLVGTIAFPSVKRVLRFNERFADSAFTKEHDD